MTRRDVQEAAAVTANLNRIIGGSDLTLVERRIREFADGVKAAAYDPDRTSAPNRVALIDGERVVVPNISDPTGETAINPTADVPDLASIIRRYNRVAAELERVWPEYARSTDPSLFDLKATDTADKVRPAAGVCEACEATCTGLRTDRIKRGVCPRCYQRVIRGENRGFTREQTIAQIRANPELDMERVIIDGGGDAA